MIDIGDALKPLPPPRLRTRVFFAAWQVFAHLLLPLAILFFVVQSRREPLYRKNLHQRFGLGDVGPRGAVWIFATSLGETRAISPLVRLLLDKGHAVCLTHASPAGLTEGRRLFDDPRVTHRYVPFDFWWSTWLFLNRLKPRIGLVVEGEYWPGHVQVADWLGVPMLHINGNLNRRSLEQAKRTANLRLDILTRFQAITTKSEPNRQRYISAGVEPARVLVMGELKFDQWIDDTQLETGRRLRAEWSPDRCVLLIASSVTDEEERLISLVTHLLSLDLRPRIVWAPRSPQRYAALAERLERAGVPFVRRSDVLDENGLGSLTADADVLLADSLGEMNIWYQMADLVFVGATLVDMGGHNISEPLALARPVLLGPSIYGITFPAEDAHRDGAVRILPDITAITTEAERLLTDPAELKAFTERARTFSQRHVGASGRTMKLVQQVIEAREH